MLIAAAIFGLAGLAMLVYGLVHGRDPEQIAKTIAAELSKDSQRPDPYAEKLRQPLAQRVLYPAFRAVGEFLAGVAPSGLIANYRKTLEMAGRPAGLTVEAYIGLKLILLALALVGSAFVWRAVGEGKYRMSLTVAPLVVAVLAPEMWLSRRIQKRRKEFVRAFPDVLDLLSLSVEAGLGLDGALQEVVKRRNDVAGEELGRVLEEIQLGTPRALAWKHLAERIPAYEVTTFAAAVVQAEQLGTSVAQVLRAQGDAVRMRRAMAIREAAAKMPTKLLFPLIFFIFPCVFVVILGPGAIRVMHTFANL